jgi:outer membrane lipoprotein SlyB
MKPRLSFLLGLLVVALGLSGCAATVTGLKHKDLDVQTQMSEPIFIEPVSADRRTVWLDVKSTCTEGIDLSPLPGMLTARGYRVVTDPEAAQYQLQITCLHIQRAQTAAIDTPLGHASVLGMTLAGAIAGAALGDFTGFIGGAIGAGVAEVVLGALVKSVTYTMVTDVQVSERSAAPVAKEQTATLPQGTQTQVHEQVAPETIQWKHYRNRVTSTATKVNLGLEEAKPVLVKDLLKTLVGIL